MDKIFNLLGVAVLCLSCGVKNRLPWTGDNHIKPYEKNTAYWQYKGNPVLLLGATDNDNLFQNTNVKMHLDSLKNAGGNYIRNTMSDRDEGNLHAFSLNDDGKYDLNKWNDEYWQRFENLIKLAWQRDVIVQIEVWDRFDHSRDPWKNDPYNPNNNINYSFHDSGLDSIYPLHPGQNVQPFFFTVPELNNNTILLKYQQMFVEKLMAISLNYDNILYCIDNETSGSEEWATYWAEFIKSYARNKDIYITEMWDDWDVKSATHKRTLDHPDRYRFIDISQNSQISGPENWRNAQYVFDYIRDNPRPVNSTKIYGSDKGSWLSRGITTKHAVNTFFRNILGGFASSRFHRPPSGLGLSDISINCIGTIRKVMTIVNMWDITPRMDLLEVNENSEVYLAAREGDCYVIYFTEPGTVKLNLSNYDISFTLRWISVTDSGWKNETMIQGGKFVDIKTNLTGGAIAVLSVSPTRSPDNPSGHGTRMLSIF